MSHRLHLENFSRLPIKGKTRHGHCYKSKREKERERKKHHSSTQSHSQHANVKSVLELKCESVLEHREKRVKELKSRLVTNHTETGVCCLFVCLLSKWRRNKEHRLRRKWAKIKERKKKKKTKRRTTSSYYR